MSLDPMILTTLLERINEGRADLAKAEEKRDEVIALHDQLRDIAYVEWDEDDIKGFKKGDRKTWPLVFQNQEAVFGALDQLNLGVGYLHELVITHRYPEMHQQETPIYQPAAPAAPQGTSQVYVQQPPVQIQREDISKVRSFWTGFHERAIEKRRLEHIERIAELEALEKRKMPDITTAKVQRDPVEAHNELLAALNATKTFLADCYLCWEGNHKNHYFATQTHTNFRSRVSRLMGAIESFVYATMDLELKEIRNTLNQQMHLFTRILEAQAQQDVTIQEFHKPFKESGYGSLDLEPKTSKRMQLEGSPEQPQVIDMAPGQTELEITAPEPREVEEPEEEF